MQPELAELAESNSRGARAQTLLLLAPSDGFGGGIERFAKEIELAWPGPVLRVDLYRLGHNRRAEGSLPAKTSFALRALVTARRERPAIVLSLHVGLLPVGVFAARIVGGRSALFAIGTEVWGTMSTWSSAVVRRCSHVLSISSFSAQMVARRARVSTEVPVVLPPVSQAFADVAESEPSPAGAERRTQLLTVSRLDPQHRYKGHFQIARSFRKVVERLPEARWVVVGEGRDLELLKMECRRLGISHSVEFAGRITDGDLASLYMQSRALVLPSVTDVNARPPTGEGFGLVYAEAAAFGLPSIASSASGGAAELVVEGRTGLTVPPRDDCALAAAMLRLLGDDRLCQRLGADARRQVLAQHTPKRFAERLIAALSTDGAKRR